ncbi:MAG: carboxypeptidase M32, partial [Pseudomonadota bacterium]
MSAFEELMQYQRATEALTSVAGRLGWDQETMMPEGAAGQRAEEHGAMQAVLHHRRTNPQLRDWLTSAKAPDAAGAAQLRHIKRDFERASKVPVDLATRLAKLTSRSQGIWAKARGANDMAAFAPSLAEVVALKREEAAALADGGDLYDAMIDEYEPGTKASELALMFDEMRPVLVALRERALSATDQPEIKGDFDEAKQLQLSREL